MCVAEQRRRLTDVPFDSRGNRTGTPWDPRALSLGGIGVCHVMTYWGYPEQHVAHA